ncbi:hypothetical protein STEG23_028513, partial [Scotinomys teguina]
MKPEASGQGRKWKYQDKGGMVIESEALGRGKKSKCQDEAGTDLEFEEPSKTRKRIPQEQQKLQSQQPGKNQLWEPQQESLRQLKPLEWAKGILPKRNRTKPLLRSGAIGSPDVLRATSTAHCPFEIPSHHFKNKLFPGAFANQFSTKGKRGNQRCCFKNRDVKLGPLALTCNTSTWEAEAGGLLQQNISKLGLDRCHSHKYLGKVKKGEVVCLRS